MSKFIEFDTDNGKRLVHVDKVQFVAPKDDSSCLVFIDNTTYGKLVVKENYDDVRDRLSEK